MGMFLMLTGMGMFGGLSGLVASTFLNKRERYTSESEEVLRQLSELNAKIDQLQSPGSKEEGS